jgi:hypothetical protein
MPIRKYSAGGAVTSDATITADTVLEGYMGYGPGGPVIGTYNPEKTINTVTLTVPTPPTISVATAVAPI